MKNRKKFIRIVAVMLAILMLASLVPLVAAFAAPAVKAPTTAVATSGLFSVAMNAQGTVYFIGCKTWDNAKIVTTPEILATGAMAIRATQSAIYVLKSNNELWAIGEVPSKGTVKTLTYMLSNVKTFDAGRHLMIVSLSGKLYGMGDNEVSQLGDGTESYRNVHTQVSIPGIVESVHCGPNYTLAVVTNNGTREVYGAGRAADGQFTGVSSTQPSVFTKLGLTVFEADAMGAAAFGLTSTGAVQAWGSNGKGQLGASTPAMSTDPINIAALSNVNVARIVGGDNAGAAIAQDGSLYTWGDNTSGRLGNGQSAASVPTPSKVLSDVVDVSFGFNTTLAVDTSGNVWGWGQNLFNQLGAGSSNVMSPVKLFNFSNLTTAPTTNTATNAPAVTPTVKPTTAPTTPPSALAAINVAKVKVTGSLNLRKAASTSSAVVTKILNGKTVTINSMSSRFFYVTYGSYKGYVDVNYLQPTKTETRTVTLTSGTLTLRANTSTTAASLASLKNGTKVTVQWRVGEWSRVKSGTKTGFVKSSYLK